MTWQHPVDAHQTTADRIALRFAGTSITYAELEQKARAIAAGLVDQGLGRDDLIALASPRSAELAIWCWAAWHAGAAVMPLDPTYPAERLRYMLADAKPALVLVEGAAPPWAGTSATIDRARFRTRDGAALQIERRPDDLAYVIYTSGSTGRPKGVEVTARGLTNLAHAQAEIFAISPESRILNFASPSFDAYIAELLSALLTGASLHIPSAAEARPGKDLAAFCAREAITVATFPPSLLAILEPRDYPSIRTIVSAGEACSASIALRWARDRRFVNAYGPTEATVCATAGVVTLDDVANGVSIGRVLPGVEALVLGESLQPVADGEVGELVLGGIGLARGYRRAPELTASAFVTHPQEPGARVYRTGDLVRRDPDGRFFFVGRIDDQIKLRGFRIELGEIEHALRARPEIADAVAVVRSGPRTGDQLVAHVVVREGAKLDAAATRAALAERLPAFMIPDVVSPIGELPRSPNGKVDRRALPAPRPFRPPGLAAPIPPTSADEAYLVAQFAHGLGIDNVGIDDDFFALGGHSLSAVVMLARIAEERGTPLALSVFFEHPTPRALASHLGAERSRLPLCIVPLRTPPSQRPPLFLIHPVGGNPSCYLDLAAALGDDRPIYGVQNPALAGGPVEPRTIEAICADYVTAIRTVQPSGPYLIGGWSVGGNYAIEVARGLAEFGEVGPLILIDSWSPLLLPRPRPAPDDAMIAFMFIKNNLGRAAGLDLPITPADTASLSRDDRMALVRTWAARLGTLPSDVPLEQLARLVDVFGQTLRAHLDYEPAPYLGEVVHIQASSPAIGHPRPPTLGWEGVFPNERVIVIPDTTHFVFIYPPIVNLVAPLVRDALGAFT